METKHTPGPWQNQEGFNTVFTTTNPEKGTGLTIAIAKVLSNQVDGGHDEATANARLIAAAPELLEALQRMVANHLPLTGNPSHEQLVEHWEYEKSQGNGEAEDMLFVMAAIAKATGAAA